MSLVGKGWAWDAEGWACSCLSFCNFVRNLCFWSFVQVTTPQVHNFVKSSCRSSLFHVAEVAVLKPCCSSEFTIITVPSSVPSWPLFFLSRIKLLIDLTFLIWNSVTQCNQFFLPCFQVALLWHLMMHTRISRTAKPVKVKKRVNKALNLFQCLNLFLTYTL